MTTKVYFAKNKIHNNYFIKYKLNISDIITKLNINTGEDVENLIIDLEKIYTNLYNKYNQFSNKNSLGYKILEKKILRLEIVIHNIRALEVRFRNDEEGLDEPNTEYEYEDIIEDLEDDVREELLCI